MSHQPVRQPSGQPDQRGAEGGHPDRQIGPQGAGHLQVREVEMPVVPVEAPVGPGLPGQNQLDNPNGLGQAGYGRIVGDSIVLVVKAAHAGTESEGESSLAQAVEVESGQGGLERGPREPEGDTGRQRQGRRRCGRRPTVPTGSTPSGSRKPRPPALRPAGPPSRFGPPNEKGAASPSKNGPRRSP